MTEIERGLEPEARAESMHVVHTALAALGLEIDVEEREAHQLGPSTAAALSKLQAMNSLPETGELDEQTLVLIEATISRMGLPGNEHDGHDDGRRTISGIVTDKDGRPLADACVIAFDCDLRATKRVGQTRTKQSGGYLITYTKANLLGDTAAADLQVEVRDTDDKTVFTSPITFNAPAAATINVALGGPEHTHLSELVSLITTVTPLLGTVTPLELVENDQHQDLTFLSGETGIAKLRLAYWTLAERIAETTDVAPEFFYAVLRGNVPADAQTMALASSSQGVDLDGNAQRLLDAILSTSQTALSGAVDNAIAANIVRASYADELQADLDTIASLASKAALSSNRGFGKASMGRVFDSLNLDATTQQRFVELYSANGVSPRAFWQSLAQNPDFTAGQIADLKFGVTVGRLTRGHLPLIQELAAQRQGGHISHARDLARLTVADWTALIQKQSNGAAIGTPPGFRATNGQLSVQSYAAMLERNFTTAYPTVAFSARLAGDPQPAFSGGKAVSAYLDENPSFDLRITNIDAFAQRHPIPENVRPGLLAAQRLAKVNSDYTVMSALMSDGIHSARQVYAMGRDRFVAKYGGLPALGPTHAARTFARAEQTYGVALALAMSVNATLTAANPAAIADLLPADAAEQLAAYPNLQTLFGSDSVCSCSECQSVLGAPAYLADMLEFLSHRSASGGRSVRDVLLARRPDIALIELSCPNTNTALPYIDLVNELLEDAVAPTAAGDPTYARNRQTSLTTEELNANPQYANPVAYDQNHLGGAVYPWTLPFDLPLTEARTYLGQLGLDRASLSRTFQKPDPPTIANPAPAQVRAIAVEVLGMNPVEADIVAGVATGNNAWDYWGLAQSANSIADPADPTKRVTGSWTQVLTQVRVLINRAGLTYQELARLLNTIFINGDGAITIVCDPPDSCDVSTMTIGWGTDDPAVIQDRLERIHRLVRLWRRLGWDLYDLDDAIVALQAGTPTGLGQLSDQFLRQVAVVKSLVGRRGLRVREAVAMLTALPTRNVPTLPGDAVRNSLYHDLFQNNTVLNPPDVSFQLSAQGTEVNKLGEKLSDHSPALLAAFQLIESDLNLLIATLTDGNLTLANLSTLYRHATLAGVLDVSVAHLIKLLATAEIAIDPVPGYERISTYDGTTASGRNSPFDLARPETVLTFAALVNASKDSGLTFEQVDWIARDAYDATSGVAPDATTVGTLLLSLWTGLTKIATQAGPPQDPTSLVVQTLAQSLGVATKTAVLLVKWLPSATNPGHDALSDFLALPSVALVDKTDPISPTTAGFRTYFTTYAALAKLAAIIKALTLSTDDVAWWKDFGVAAGWLDPTTIPSTLGEHPSATAEGRFNGLARIVTADQVRDRVTVSATSFAALFGIAGAAQPFPSYLAALEALTQWSQGTLTTLCGGQTNANDTGILSLTYPDDFASEVAVARIAPAIDTLTRTGIPAALGDWIAPSVTAPTADAIKQAVKGRYPTEQWLTLAKQLRDPLRQEQRDALVSYLLAAPPPPGVTRWRDPDDVFGQFLIDVEMCSCMASSRIVQATTSVQLFVLRCFLDLESPAVSVDVNTDGDWSQWQWMSQYRLWQANREVFLFPENWIDPTLRANKSPFFSDLEQELRQGDVTSDAVETALANYLEKLETVARLDVCGMFHDMEIDQGESRDMLHVVARTQASPPMYYTRAWVDSATWTPWQKIDLDINSEHVLPLVWNGKPYLFWAIVNRVADQSQSVPAAKPNQIYAPGSTNVHLEVQLAWSQFKQGKWQPRQTSPQVLAFQGESDTTNITLKANVGDQLEIDVYVDVIDTVVEVTYFDDGLGDVTEIDTSYSYPDPTTRQHVGTFVLGGKGTGAEAFVADTSTLQSIGGLNVASVGALTPATTRANIASPTATVFDGDWYAPGSTSFLSAQRPRVAPMFASYQLYGPLQSEEVLQRADYFRLVVPHQLPAFDSSLPFFYRDSGREYFVVPAIYYQNGNYFTINAPAYVYHPFYKTEYRFWPFYHPFVGLLASTLNWHGVDGLYARELQLHPAEAAGVAEFDFGAYYQPTNNVLTPYPTDAIDFDPQAGYALYNWELFYHAPILVANTLSAHKRFDLAKRWYEYVFDPAGPATDKITGASIGVPQRFWITRPFFMEQAPDYANQQLARLMGLINSHDPTLDNQVAAWRKDPFDPDMLAQLRPVAYQRAVVMKYIDNLISWGDQLFTQDTMESVNLATQMYVLADELLGPRPQIVPPRVQPIIKTYADLEGTFDDFSNALVAAENAIPPVRVSVSSNGGTPRLPSLSTLYFRIPPNDELLRYWDTVADRLFKIRHCMNIEGVVQQLPLFAPPISPGLLVAAAAAGLDLSSVLSDMQMNLPPYRFRMMIRHAIELCENVRGYGGELLAALEKSDAEQLARIRSGAERQIQAALSDVRAREIDAATQAIDVLAKTKQTFLDRQAFYGNRPLMNDWEAASLVVRGASLIPQALAGLMDVSAALIHLAPTVNFGISGFGGSPQVTATWGSENLAGAASSASAAGHTIAGILQTGAELASVLGSHHQRQDGWRLEAQVAADEIARIDAETLGAQIRLDIAQKQKAEQDLSTTEAADVDDFLHSKFTDQELYGWMLGQTSTTYFQAYQLAYATAKQAERCFRRELGIYNGGPDTSYIQFGYWDSLRNGLTAADKLLFDLRRMENAYYTENSRELELTKHVSLLQIDPYALVELRNTGKCTIELPEILFDLDNPGHYMRRLKNVSVTIPCVVGPYGGVSLSLTLMDNKTRTSTDTSVPLIDDPGGTSQIVTSSAQNDSGMFELRFEDERYLPFEGSGAISTWQLTLNNVYPQFDYSSITDVVLTLRMTARDGGDAFRGNVVTSVQSELNNFALTESRKGLYRLISARHEYPTEWAKFLNPPAGSDQVLTIETPPERFPFFTRGMDLKAVAVDVIARTADAGDYTLVINPPGSTRQTATLSADATLSPASFVAEPTPSAHHVAVPPSPPFSPAVDLGRAPTPSDATPPAWTIKLKKAGVLDYQSLTQSDLDDLILVIAYTATP